MTYAFLENGTRCAAAAVFLFAAAIMAPTHAGETGSIEGMAARGEGPAAQYNAAPVDSSRTRTPPAKPLVSVAVTVLDLGTLSPASFGDLDESTP